MKPSPENARPKYHVLITDNVSGAMIESSDVLSLYVALSMCDGITKKISLGEKTVSYQRSKFHEKGEF